MMFRTVHLPENVSGRLYLHSMPGREEPFQTAREAIVRNKIDRVVCLTLPKEIEQKSPDYAKAIAAGVPWTHLTHPIPDGGITTDSAGYQVLAQSIADALRKGKNVLVHCMAGIGRTGTFAVAVLSQLGVSLEEARRRVIAAGSSAESEGQQRFLESICGD
jgi:protein-tyrosine phosphatase